MPFVPKALLEKLVIAAEACDTFGRCGDCGAWFFHDEPDACTLDEMYGCWWMATRRDADAGTCFRRQACRMVGAYTMGPRSNPFD